jgi:tetratricopeptide (TPR) repeat protein
MRILILGLVCSLIIVCGVLTIWLLSYPIVFILRKLGCMLDKKSISQLCDGKKRSSFDLLNDLQVEDLFLISHLPDRDMLNKKFNDSLAKTSDFRPQLAYAYSYQWLLQGRKTLQLKRLEEALIYFNQAEKLLRTERRLGTGKLATPLSALFSKIPTAQEIQKLREIQTTFEEICYVRGEALIKLGRYEQALENFNNVTLNLPDFSGVTYHKACCHAALRNIEQAVENLQQAIQLNSEKYLEKAKTDSIFDPIRQDSRFQKLMG